MLLKEKLRMDFTNYIRPLLIKDCCEVCGCKEDLELHHMKQFSVTLEETLKELNLQDGECDSFTKEELEMIRNIMIGKQMRQKYMTLCSRCHDEIPVIRTKRKLSEREEFAKEIKEIFRESIISSAMYEDLWKVGRPYKYMKLLEDRLYELGQREDKSSSQYEEDYFDWITDFLEFKTMHPNFNMDKYIEKYSKKR